MDEVKHQVRPPEKVTSRNQAETIAQSTQTDHRSIPDLPMIISECRSRNTENHRKKSSVDAKTNSDRPPGRASQRKQRVPDRFGDVVLTAIV